MPFSNLFVSQLRICDDIPSDMYYSQLAVVKSIQRQGVLQFEKPVTIFVGENGVGKSTLIEAIAVNMGFNPEGGTVNFDFHTRDSHSELYKYIKVSKGISRNKDGFFVRAESFYNVATNVDELNETPTFVKREYIASYGGKSLHSQSHGESFFSLLENRFTGDGLYILDEPEAGLSPYGVMRVMVTIKDLVDNNSQFIISTHSPILMAFPDADVINITNDDIIRVPYYETEHFKTVKNYLDNPERILKYLLSN